MDVDDLEKKLVEYPNCKFCLISHMRGKIADMDAVKDACDRHDVVLLEDCAHSLGVEWKGTHTGHVGKVAAISAQSYKMINSGEGGFLLTDDAEIAAKCAVYAGAYEGLAGKHTTVPGPEVFADLPTQIPNYSLRMSAIAAAVIRPQILTLDERREKYNKRYSFVTEKLVERKGHLLSIPVNTPGMTPVHDSLQFNLSHDITDEQVQRFLDECATHGLPVEQFGHKTNARNFVNWKFAPADQPLPLTAKMLSRACDPEVFADLPTQIPNYSLRMSAIAAAVIRPQILTLDERREKYNKRYSFVTEKLVERKGHLLSIPVNTPGMTPVHDSLQFNLSHDITDEQVQRFLDECATHGLPVEQFGHKTNARNFVNWKFAPADQPLPLTAKMLSRACDVRLPLMWDDEDFETLVDVLCESLDAAVADEDVLA